MNKLFRKNSINIMGIVMCICFVCAIAVLVFFNTSWMHAVQVFQISSELFCMAVVLVIYMWYLRRIQDDDRSRKLYSILCVLIYVALFIDLITWAIDGIVSYRMVNYFTNAIVYILTFIYGWVFVEYIFSYIAEENKQAGIIKKIIYIILAIISVIRLINIFSGRYYTVDENGYYSTGEMFLLSFTAIPVIIVFLCGLAAGYGVSVRRIIAFLSYPASMLAMAGIAYINEDYANTLIVTTLSMIFIYCVNFLDTEETRDSLDKSMKVYLSEDIVNHLTSTDGAVTPGGSMITLSMIFCMLHNFSSKIETMGPEDAVKILNHFLGEMTDIIADNDGTLLEFPGYGFFCIFGAYDSKSNHATAAVRAAYQMQKRMQSVNRWNNDNDYPELSIGVGINTGDVVLGNIGSSNHMRYTAISRHVNLASRIESYSNDGEIIVTQNTVDACDNIIDAEKIMTIIPKGISDPMSVYKVIEIDENI